MEWDAPAKSQIIADDRDFIEEHASVKQVAKCPEEATSVSLQECFRYKKHPTPKKFGVFHKILCTAYSPWVKCVL